MAGQGMSDGLPVAQVRTSLPHCTGHYDARREGGTLRGSQKNPSSSPTRHPWEKDSHSTCTPWMKTGGHRGQTLSRLRGPSGRGGSANTALGPGNTSRDGPAVDLYTTSAGISVIWPLLSSGQPKGPASGIWLCILCTTLWTGSGHYNSLLARFSHIRCSALGDRRGGCRGQRGCLRILSPRSTWLGRGDLPYTIARGRYV